ncbi:conserved hypothetical protein [Paecilomyces variotii No. 5]|uniref:60S ribosomal subunit assembly/export protein loc1 n=1 Tax=Byssochlamys spectabilis (strain No. 5 / NBRC 109023) TaxID=1356009 RepID=V5F6V3_BYSSN|nr:conserved hypothetical protein [Paecilomyces variotii No. 5]
MAPNRGSSSKGSAGKPSGVSKGKPSTLSSGSRVSKSSAKVKRPPPKEMKSKARTAPENLKKKKTREYTEKELDLPALNMITPVGVVKPKGKKKGKTFVDDQESMMTILAMVNAEKEGQIESKLMKARQMEEIREAKRKEAEARQQEKKSKLEETKDSLRRKKRKSNDDMPSKRSESAETNGTKSKGKRKSVSFA